MVLNIKLKINYILMIVGVVGAMCSGKESFAKYLE